jgi:hypothetical protein
MADTFTSTLGTIVMGIGGDNNQWGQNLNVSVFQILEDAIANPQSYTVTGGTLDLSTNAPPLGPSLARYAYLIFSGALTSNQTVIVPNLPKWWMVSNLTTGAFTLSMKTPSGTAVVIPQGGGANVQQVYCTGANVISVSPFNWAQVAMPNGSAGAPSYSYANEASSGWYRNGTQDIRLAVNGADVLQVTGAGAGTPSVMNLLAGALQVGGAQVIPPGAEQAYAGINLPAGWLWEDGSAYSRTGSTANLFGAITTTVVGNTNSSTAITGLASDMRGKGLNGAYVEGTGIPTGTTITFTGATTATLSQAATSANTGLTLRILPYGQGDASTTFNVPDRRERALYGRGDMNVSSDPGRITSAVAGFNPIALNGAGGSQSSALSSINQVPQFTPVFTGQAGTATSTQNGIPSGVTTASQLGNGTGGTGNNQPINGTTGQITSNFTPAGTIAAIGSASPSSFGVMNPAAITNMIIKT